MLKSYLIMAIRGFLKTRAHTLINIFGLTIGIGSFILILLYIQKELSFDRFNRNADRIFRIHNTLRLAEGEYPYPTCNSALPLRATEEIPEVLGMTRLVKIGAGFDPTVIVRVGDDFFKETSAYFADSSFFDIFTCKVLEGDPGTALDQPFTLVMTKSAAARCFKGLDPMGKTVTLTGPRPVNFTVTAIIEDPPSESHMRYSMLFSLSTADNVDDGDNARNDGRRFTDSWDTDGFYSYLLLRDREDESRVEQAILGLVSKYVKEENSHLHRPELFPLTKIHLYSNLRNELQPNSNIQQVYIFLVVAIFILLIASINYINLSTAIAARRAREVGIRKVFGASRQMLVNQFMGESVLITIISTFLALIFVDLMIPLLNNLTGLHIQLKDLFNPYMLMILTGIVIFVGFLSGSYPSLILSSFQPTEVIKGINKQGINVSEKFRQALVVVQFSISLVLIISAWNIFRQIQYIRNKPLGYQKQNILVIENSSNTLTPKLKEFRSELLENPGIEEVSASFSTPGGLRPMVTVKSDSIGSDEDLTLAGINITFEFLKTLNIPVREGRDLDPENRLDSGSAVILNQKAVKALRLGPQPVGKTVTLDLGDDQVHKRTVVGVVDDINFEPLYRPTEPAFYAYVIPFFSYIFIRLDGIHNQENLEIVREKWEEFVPGEPFTFNFLDRTITQLYTKENKLGEVLGYFTVLAVLIAVLGLYGLSSYAILQRSKEIGIRRALGATTSGILYLFSSRYLMLSLTAALIAWPVTYFFLLKWMENFTYHTGIFWMAFLAGAFIVILLAQLTVLMKVFQISRIDPVKTLKYE